MVPALVCQVAQPPIRLDIVWPQLYWSVPDRGVLLVVAPAAHPLRVPGSKDVFDPFGLATPAWQQSSDTAPKVTPLGIDENPRLNPAEVVPAYGLQLLRFGGVTVLAPTRMRAIEPAPLPEGAAELLTRGANRGYLYPLLATFSSGQWERATGAQGIGAGELNATQQRLFQRLLPPRVRFEFAGTPPIPDRPNDAPADWEPPLLPVSERNSLRLRLTRSLQVTANTRDDFGFGLYVPGGRPRRGDGREVSLRPNISPNKMEEIFSGVKTVAARRKPSDLNFDSGALSAPVELEGVVTVEQLVERIAQVTDLPLLADARVAPLPLALRGQRARAGDLLAALCRGLNGTVRRVSDGNSQSYILTDDVIPLVQRSAVVTSQVLSVLLPTVMQAMEDQRQSTLARLQLVPQNVAGRLPRQGGDRYGETLWKAAESGQATAPLALLSAETQDQLQKQFQRYHEDYVRRGAQGTPPSAPTQLQLTQNLIAELVAPGLQATAPLESVDLAGLRPDQGPPQPLPPLAWPKATTTHAVLVRLPERTDDVEKLVAVAKARAVTELRVLVPGGEAAEKSLTTLIGSAQRAGLGVVPVLTPLRAEGDNAPRDRSLLGQTVHEWERGIVARLFRGSVWPLATLVERVVAEDPIVPEAVDVVAVTRRLKRLGQLPGVTGLGLAGLTAPGYYTDQGMEGIVWTGGGDPTLRLTALRQQKSDPADRKIGLAGGMPRSDAWNRMLLQRSEALARRLGLALDKAGLAVPLSVQSAGMMGAVDQRWEKWRGLAVMPRPYDQRQRVATAARPALKQLSYLDFMGETMNGGRDDFTDLLDTPARFRQWLLRRFERFGAPGEEDTEVWEGVVLDFSDLPVAETVRWLESTLAVR